MHVLVIMNQKGGVGKTTTATSLGYELARRGRRVLLIDNDPQGNATSYLGVRELRGGGLPMLYAFSGARPDALVQPAREGLAGTFDLLGASIDLLGGIAAAAALPEEGAARLLRHEAYFAEHYDVVFVDCAPTPTFATVVALNLLLSRHASRQSGVLVPLTLEAASAQGLSQIRETLSRVSSGGLAMKYFVPVRVDFRLKMARQLYEQLREAYGEAAVLPVVRDTVRVGETPAYGQTIFEYDPESTAAADYLAVASALIERLEVTP